MEPLPNFPLFPDPEKELVIERSAIACDLCAKNRGYVYTGPQDSLSSETESLTICPWCIADGSAGSRGITFNDSTMYPAFDSTPQLSRDDADLVERRTPGFTTWQGNHWLMCCGRACIYLGEADSADLSGRWADAVPSMFKDGDLSQEDIKVIVANIARGGSPCAYVFQCQLCGAPRAYWDCD